MPKQTWYLLLVPLVCWAVHLCWMTGYRNGYQAGHDDGWNRARHFVGQGGSLAEAHSRPSASLAGSPSTRDAE